MGALWNERVVPFAVEVVATQRELFEAFHLLVGDLDASPALRERLEERDYLYVRHFDPDIGLGWRQAFQTDDRAAVERYCADNDIELTSVPAQSQPTYVRTSASRSTDEDRVMRTAPLGMVSGAVVGVATGLPRVDAVLVRLTRIGFSPQRFRRSRCVLLFRRRWRDRQRRRRSAACRAGC